jgi:hypothetical protein
MKYKQIKQELADTRIRLAFANSIVSKQIDHIAALNKFIENAETIQRITETNLEKQWVIVDYLQERNEKLVLAIHNV